MSKCIICGSDLAIEKDDLGQNIYRCKATNQYGCSCKECGARWHSSKPPWSGYTIKCPNNCREGNLQHCAND